MSLRSYLNRRMETGKLFAFLSASARLKRTMPLFELTHESLAPIPRTTMQEQSFKEREDIQRLLRKSSSLLGDDLYVIAEEFSQWSDSRRRIDLLAIDRDAALVIIELKRSEDGGHMELQAIRYAAMISTLTFQQAVSVHAKFLGDPDALVDAEAALLDFLGLEQAPEEFGKTVRIVLVSPDFSKELTTTVLWLNNTGRLDIRCIRLRPYALDGRVLLEVDQIIPLREAQEYTVRLKEKQEEARRSTTESTIDFTRYDLVVNGITRQNLWKRNLIREVLKAAATAGLSLEALTAIFPARKMVVVDGHPRGEAFYAAAEAAKAASGYVFRPNRLFMNDDQLIDLGSKTVAISNQWGISSLPLVDQIIQAVPSACISYKPAGGHVETE